MNKLTKIWVKLLEKFLQYGLPTFLGCFDPFLKNSNVKTHQNKPFLIFFQKNIKIKEKGAKTFFQ